MGGNFHGLDEVEQFANKTFADCRSYPPHTCMRTYVQKFADKTFAEGGYAAKFVKVFTHESFRLYSITHSIVYYVICISIV